MKCNLKAKTLDIETGGKLVVVLNEFFAEENGLHPLDRVVVSKGSEEIIAIVDLSDTVVSKGEVAIFEEVRMALKIKTGDVICVEPTDRPHSVEFIRKKLDGVELSASEISSIISDIMDNRLSDAEATAFVTGVYTRNLTMKEIVALTKAIVASGSTLNVKRTPILDKHCVPFDTPLALRNGNNIKVKNIGALVEAKFKTGKIKREGKAEYVEVPGIKALTFDDNFKMTASAIKRFYRIKAPKFMRRVILQGNRSVTCTPEHTIFSLRNGEIVNVPAGSLKEGDLVVVPNKKDFESSTMARSIIKLPKGKKKFNTSIRVSKELMRFLGYYVSEGFSNYQGMFLNFGSHEDELIKDAAFCIEKVFGVKPTKYKPHSTAVRLCIYSQAVVKAFSKQVNTGKGAIKKQIPKLVFNVPRGLQFEFLRALFNGDGHVRRGYEAIYVTASDNLARDLKYLLSLLGLTFSYSVKSPSVRRFPHKTRGFYESKTKKCYYIYTQAREIYGNREKANVSFMNLLPLKAMGKIDASHLGWMDKRKFKQEHITKETAQKFKEVFKDVFSKKFVDGDLGVLKVKKNLFVKSPSKYMYDIQMEKYNRFLAGDCVFIHNSIGGVVGNRTTMIVIPIIASLGLTIPKTSSRAITSPAGTADVVEVLTKVNLSLEEIRKVVETTNGCMVWGGAVNLAAADDKLIRIRHPLHLDPIGMMLASIMAKKKAVGAEILVIDIPAGRGAKVPHVQAAEELGNKFLTLGKSLGMKIEVLITDGSHPIGSHVGPALEARDVLTILKSRGEAGSQDVLEKSCQLAGILLELAAFCSKGTGYDVALKQVTNGKAFGKFREIVSAQGGNPDITVEDIKIGKFSGNVIADRSGRIHHIDNRGIAAICRAAGCPKDHGSGMILHVQQGDKIKKGQILYEVFAESKSKLDAALALSHDKSPIELQKFVLKQISSQPVKKDWEEIPFDT